MLIDEFCDRYCRPFNIFHFIYIEIFYSGKVDVISNNRKYLEIYLEKQFPFSSELKLMIDSSPLNENFFFLWPKNVNEKLPLLLDELLICNGITLFEKTKDSLQTFAFATDQLHDNLINFYINHFDVLKKIKQQFLLAYTKNDTFHKNTFFIPPVIRSNISNNGNLDFSKIRFDNIIKINEKIFSISNGKMKILKQLSCGKSSKEVATILGISPRTVEKQLESLMNLTGIHSRHLLIQAINKEN